MSVRKKLALLSVLLVVVIGAADSVPAAKYTARAYLVVAVRQPTILSHADEKVNWDEFKSFRDDQASLIRHHFVIQAALRNRKLKNLACIQREDARHNAVTWLASQIRVEFPDAKSGIMEVSTTQPNPREAAELVNAVVEAYMDEIANADRQKRRNRYDSLQRIAAEKEDEVRRKREQLKRELESIGAGDNTAVGLRTQLAVNLYGEYQRHLLLMKLDRTALEARLDEAKLALQDLSNERISELEISRLLYSMPAYRELITRKTVHEVDKLRGETAAAAVSDHKSARMPSEPDGGHGKSGDDERKAIDKITDGMHAQCLEMLREAKRLELEHRIRELAIRINTTTERLVAFEKEVDVKSRDADAVGRTSIAAQMQRADLESAERVLSAVVDERERLRIELQTPSRVTILGDSNAPAAVPENPD